MQPAKIALQEDAVIMPSSCCSPLTDCGQVKLPHYDCRISIGETSDFEFATQRQAVIWNCRCSHVLATPFLTTYKKDVRRPRREKYSSEHARLTGIFETAQFYTGFSTNVSWRPESAHAEKEVPMLFVME